MEETTEYLSVGQYKTETIVEDLVCYLNHKCMGHVL
jgi:hypothetical protein